MQGGKIQGVQSSLAVCKTSNRLINLRQACTRKVSEPGQSHIYSQKFSGKYIERLWCGDCSWRNGEICNFGLWMPMPTCPFCTELSVRIAGPDRFCAKETTLSRGKIVRKPWRLNKQFEPFEVAKVAGTLMQVFGAERLNRCLQGQEQLTLSKSGDLRFGMPF